MWIDKGAELEIDEDGLFYHCDILSTNLYCFGSVTGVNDQRANKRRKRKRASLHTPGFEEEAETMATTSQPVRPSGSMGKGDVMKESPMRKQAPSAPPKLAGKKGQADRPPLGRWSILLIYSSRG